MRVRWWGLWYCPGYSDLSMIDEPTGVETFASIDDVRRALRDRYDSNGVRTVTVHYADGRTESALFPCVTRESEYLVYGYDPRETSDPYPVCRVFWGPRGGVRVEDC